MKWLLVALVAAALMVGCGDVTNKVAAPTTEPLAEPTNAVNKATIRWPAGDWSANVAWEARHAMSSKHNGTSNWQVSADAYGPRWLADRCYTGSWNGDANDPFALSKASAEAFGYVGTIGHEVGGSHHYSGWCTFLMRLILYRSSYGLNNGYHLTTPNYGKGSMWDWCNSAYMTRSFETAKPGWCAFKPPPNEHALILDQRATVNGRDGWWVIDGNYVGTWLIGRHFMPMTVLKSQYWAWAPTLATSN